jgi:solute carrier family 25 oxoglutarate transporter 11
MAAQLFVQPMDLLKNRMQMSTENHRTTAAQLSKVVNNEGWLRTQLSFLYLYIHLSVDYYKQIFAGTLALYDGLSAGLFRQATYTTVRLGIYTYLLEELNR